MNKGGFALNTIAFKSDYIVSSLARIDLGDSAVVPGLAPIVLNSGVAVPALELIFLRSVANFKVLAKLFFLGEGVVVPGLAFCVFNKANVSDRV